MDVVTVRQIARDDIDQIKTLWEALLQHHHDRTTRFKRYYQSNNFAKRKAELKDKLELAVFVAEADSKQVGFCVASIDKNIANIDSLYVATSARSLGVGDGLMQHAMHWINEFNVSAVRLHVGEGNEEAMSFYERHGFSVRATMMELTT